MSTAIIQGATGGIGAPLTRLLLQRSNLNIVALTSKASSSQAQDIILSEIQSDRREWFSKRLHVIPNVNLLEETTVKEASDEVKERYKNSIRLMVCLAGGLHPEKSLQQISPASFIHAFQLNTLGHLLLYKHFVPLIPTQRDFSSLSSEWKDDPAKGVVGSSGGVCLSLSARVGSIEENGKGGWYSYRASKAALNQVIRTLDHELVNKKSSALALAYHPGTTLTTFTRPIIGSPSPDASKGIFTATEAAEKLLSVVGQARRELGGDGKVVGRGWGGGFRDWKGEVVPF